MSKNYPYAYIRKKIVASSKATVPVQCKAVQYGIGCFSGIRGFWNKEHKNLYLFRLEDHFKRFKESAKIMHMKLDLTFPKFEQIIRDLIKKNKVKEDCYIRPTLYAASTKLTPRVNNPDDDVAIYMIPLKDYFSADKALNVCISSWRRIDDDVISTKAKVTGAYAASAVAKSEAILNGFDEPIFLNRDGKVCEASGANVFGIKDGVVWTPPLGSNILNGITRRTLITLLRDELGVEVREESFDRSMLYVFDELFFSGTAAKVSCIGSVDHRKIGTGRPGKITKKLQKVYDQVANGELAQYNDWLTAIY
jgi:branched-chain amino acid aminotransferase